MGSLFRLVKTSNAMWIVPTRMAIALLLAFPIGGTTRELLAWCSVSSLSCWTIRLFDILCSVTFATGLFLRVAMVPALVIFGLRAIAHLGGSFWGIQLETDPRIGILTWPWSS
jgi:putative oxidoreductase